MLGTFRALFALFLVRGPRIERFGRSFFSIIDATYTLPWHIINGCGRGGRKGGRHTMGVGVSILALFFRKPTLPLQLFVGSNRGPNFAKELFPCVWCTEYEKALLLRKCARCNKMHVLNPARYPTCFSIVFFFKSTIGEHDRAPLQARPDRPRGGKRGQGPSQQQRDHKDALLRLKVRGKS